MSFIPFIIIAIVIGSIIKAVQSGGENRFPNAGKGLQDLRSSFQGTRRYLSEQTVESPMAHTTELATHQKEKETAQEKNRSFHVEKPGIMGQAALKSEDLESDFGDGNDSSSKDFKDKSLMTVGSEKKMTAGSKQHLNLRPTRKRLMEAFILAECFSEPRSKKPYRPRFYTENK